MHFGSNSHGPFNSIVIVCISFTAGASGGAIAISFREEGQEGQGEGRLRYPDGGGREEEIFEEKQGLTVRTFFPNSDGTGKGLGLGMGMGLTF